MERWVDKVAVVTGASAGIGAATCVRLARAGLRVVGLARRPARVEELKSQVSGGGSIHARQCDVSRLEDIADAFRWVEEEFGGVDVMVNNAGVYFAGNITDINDHQMSEEQLHATLDTNVRAVMACTRRAVHSMKQRSVAGHIVNISSICGHYIPFSDQFNIYSSTKYAVTAFSQALLNEMATAGSTIRVTSISPGLVDTAMASKARHLPMLSPNDVADAVLYAIGTPPTVNINEITITPVLEKRL